MVLELFCLKETRGSLMTELRSPLSKKLRTCVRFPIPAHTLPLSA